jgi:hypothetical protein
MSFEILADVRPRRLAPIVEIFDAWEQYRRNAIE